MITVTRQKKNQGNTIGGSAILLPIYKTGKTDSYRIGDDGDLRRGGGTDFLTLNSNNYFGNTDRFTDINGLQLYPNNIVLDWAYWDKSTGKVYGWQKEMTAERNLTSHLADQPYLLDGFNDWYVPNRNEVLTLCNEGAGLVGNSLRWFNYPPFNYISSIGDGRFWSSTWRTGNKAIIFGDGSMGETNFWGFHRTRLMRIFNTNEL